MMMSEMMQISAQPLKERLEFIKEQGMGFKDTKLKIATIVAVEYWDASFDCDKPLTLEIRDEGNFVYSLRQEGRDYAEVRPEYKQHGKDRVFCYVGEVIYNPDTERYETHDYRLIPGTTSCIFTSPYEYEALAELLKAFGADKEAALFSN